MKVRSAEVLLDLRLDQEGGPVGSRSCPPTGVPRQGVSGGLLDRLQAILCDPMLGLEDPRRAAEVVMGLIHADQTRQVHLESLGGCVTATVMTAGLGDRRFVLTRTEGCPDSLVRPPALDPNLLQAIIDQVPAAISVKNRDRRYVFVNRVWETYHGIARDAVVGRRFEDVTAGAVASTSWGGYSSEIKDRDQVVLDGLRHSMGYEEHFYDNDGQLRTLLSNKVPLHDGVHGLVGILSVTLDITDRKRAEAEVADAKQRAEAASEAKTRFLGAMSHELRTPLNIIIGFADHLSKDETDPEKQGQLEFVHRAGEQLLDLVNDILYLSRAESGQSANELSRFNLPRDMAALAAMLRPTAIEKGLDLRLQIDPDVPAQVVGDRACLRRALINLVDNAIRHTPKGSILLRVDPLPAIARPGQVGVRFIVADTGVGLDAVDMIHILDPFERGTHESAGFAAGVGLSLSIANRLVQLMGGELTITSASGSGSSMAAALRFGISD